jgi:hypothetical protein
MRQRSRYVLSEFNVRNDLPLTRNQMKRRIQLAAFRILEKRGVYFPSFKILIAP